MYVLRGQILKSCLALSLTSPFFFEAESITKPGAHKFV